MTIATDIIMLIIEEVRVGMRVATFEVAVTMEIGGVAPVQATTVIVGISTGVHRAPIVPTPDIEVAKVDHTILEAPQVVIETHSQAVHPPIEGS